MKNSFILYGSWHPMVKAMTDDQAGQLLKACYALDAGEEYEITDPVAMVVFETVKATMEADRAKYDEVSEKRRQAANASKSEQMHANACKCSDLHYESESDSESDKDLKEKDKEKEKCFKKPTVEEIRAYCQERKNNVDPQAFFDHYEANGWMRGKTRIRDWRACVRTWENKAQPKARQPNKSFMNQRTYDYDALEAMLIGHGGTA